MTLTDDIEGPHAVVEDGIDDAYVYGGANALPSNWMNALPGGEGAYDGANAIPSGGGTCEDCGKGARTWDDVQPDVVDAKCAFDGTAMGKVSAASSKIPICVSIMNGEAYESVEVCGSKWIACKFKRAAFRPTKSVWPIWGIVYALEGRLGSLHISSLVSPLSTIIKGPRCLFGFDQPVPLFNICSLICK